ncbi:hypothetical protein, partial [Pseudomonas viridiflava]|uniref:hypothetical protein n=1 Tax=Pseudomonas viridiflava TaxID=33069 RepID=UPI0013CE8067
PELGVIYPLTFGDIGRKFAEFIGANASRLKTSDAADGDNCTFPDHDALGLMSESEFPSAQSIVVCETASGLIVSVSLHSAGSSSPKGLRHLDTDIQRVIDKIQVGVESKSVDRLKVINNACAQDAKSTVSRLERLLLLACVFSQGIKNSVGLHDQLLCNAATAKRLIESGIQAALVSVVETTLYPGPRLYQWAARVNSAHRDLADITRKILSSLVQETGETIALLSYDETT